MDDEQEIDIERRYCNVTMHSPGIQDGLRFINADVEYPSKFSEIASSHDPEDYTHLIYVRKLRI
jgi:hypothetical protein